MDIQTAAKLTIKKEDRIFTFECAHNANLGEIFDVMQEMKVYIVDRINEAQKQEAEKLESLKIQEIPKES